MGALRCRATENANGEHGRQQQCCRAFAAEDSHEALVPHGPWSANRGAQRASQQKPNFSEMLQATQLPLR